MNIADSERMAGCLEAVGYQSCEDPSDADVLVYNTCSIREKAEAKVYSALGRQVCVPACTGACACTFACLCASAWMCMCLSLHTYKPPFSKRKHFHFLSLLFLELEMQVFVCIS